MRTARWAVAGSLVLVGVAWVAGAAGPYLQAERMLDAAVVPPGSVPVLFLPGAVFAQPSEEPACAPLIDQVRYWIVPVIPRTSRRSCGRTPRRGSRTAARAS
jgi:hypothetical protein